MSISEMFIKAIQKWIELDNKINEINIKLKEIKTEKSNLEEQLLKYMETNNLKNTNVTLNNNIITYNTTTTQPSITIKLLTEVLDNTIQEDNIKKRILTNINLKKQQGIKFNTSLKRKKTK